MRGTSYEILEWITHHHEYAPLMQMSRQRLVGLRWKLHCGQVSERRIEEILERLNNRIISIRSTDVGAKFSGLKPIKKIRDKYVLPAVVRDHHGKFFHETTLVKMVADEHKMHDLNLDVVCRAMKRGDLPSKEVVREVIRRKNWSMFEDRMELPSVWEVEL